MSKKTFLIDVEKCTNCSLCIVACKDEHVDSAYSPWTKPQPETGQFWINVHALERGKSPRIRMTYLPLLCQHCENATCIKACSEGAIKRRDDALVWIDPAACNGCGLCQKACPYGVIYMNGDLGLAQKCTGCAHRVDEGALPRCAEVCPHDVIRIGDDADSLQSDVVPDKPLEVYHPEYHAEPRVYWKGLPTPWIAGVVIDPVRDEVIAGAEVTAIDLFEEGSFTVLSDAFGDFWMRGMKENWRYRVEIRKEGYEDVIDIVVTNGDQDLGTVCLKRTS